MTPTLSIIVPTLGRPSLAQTLESILPQLTAKDEVIVVADPAGSHLRAHATCDQILDQCLWSCLKCESDGTGIGTAQRTLGMRLALNSHLAFIDDDDTYTDGALQLFRWAACDKPVIFRMRHPQLGLLWEVPHVTYGNVGTPMFLVPNDPDRLGEWRAHTDDGHGADFTFITGCVEKMGKPVWCPEVVADIHQVGSRAAA